SRLPAPLDAATVLGQLQAELGLPVVLLVPAEDERALEWAVAGADGLALAPLDAPRLRATIELALARHRTRGGPHPEPPGLAAVLDGVADAVFAADAPGRVRFLNPAAAALTGRRREEAEGPPLAPAPR